MAYRRKSYTYSGGDAIFPIPFDFIEENDIFVYIDNKPTTDFVIENHQVKLTVIPQELPVTILITSKTDIDDSIIEWQNTASLNEENLTLANNQLLYAVQEIYDNNVQFQTDVTTTIQNNKAELEEIIANNKTELENAQNEFEEDVNTKIQEVSDAAEKINELEEAVQTATTAATNASSFAEEAEEAAIEAQNQAVIAAQKAEEVSNALTIKADTDLSNLTETGEKHFLNKTQLTNCILEAPNGVATYSGTTITVKQGLKVLIPNGRNADGTMNNIEYTLPQDLTYTNPFAYNSEYYLWLTYANGTCSVTGASTSIPFLAQEEQPDIFYAKNCIWYKPSENLIYSTANYPTTPFTPVRVCFLGKFTSTASNAVTSFTPYPTLEIIKRTDPEIQAPYVYRSYRNGNSWYKLWSDGFIEQGGLVTAAQNGDVVTFLQPYSTVVLDIQLTCSWIGSNYNSGYNTATRQNFKFYTALPLTIEPGVAVNWYSCGY